jgi:hypothetical protein
MVDSGASGPQTAARSACGAFLCAPSCTGQRRPRRRGLSGATRPSERCRSSAGGWSSSRRSPVGAVIARPSTRRGRPTHLVSLPAAQVPVHHSRVLDPLSTRSASPSTGTSRSCSTDLMETCPSRRDCGSGGFLPQRGPRFGHTAVSGAGASPRPPPDRGRRALEIPHPRRRPARRPSGRARGPRHDLPHLRDTGRPDPASDQLSPASRGERSIRG